MSTYSQATAAGDVLTKQLMGTFNGAASPVNSIGVSRDNEGYFVLVGLERPLKLNEEAQMPKVCQGVKVKYELNGTIRPF